MVEKFANKATTTLNGGINNSTTSVVVSSASAFPTTGDFRIFVKAETSNTDEIMTVTSVSGTTFTVTRASEPVAGTQSASAHSSGAEVSLVLTSGSLITLPVRGISGTKYHPDHEIPATSPSLQAEFNGSLDGFTWAPSNPTPNDVTTLNGYLIAGVSATTRWANQAWVPGSSDITIATSLSFSTLTNGGHVGLYVSTATGDDPQDLTMVQINFAHNADGAVDMYNRNGGSFSAIGAQQIYRNFYNSESKVYLRLTRAITGPVWTGYWSLNGLTWITLGTTGSKSMTVGAIGIRTAADSGTPEIVVDWVRAWTSIVSKVGA